MRKIIIDPRLWLALGFIAFGLGFINNAEPGSWYGYVIGVSILMAIVSGTGVLDWLLKKFGK